MACDKSPNPRADLVVPQKERISGKIIELVVVVVVVIKEETSYICEE